MVITRDLPTGDSYTVPDLILNGTASWKSGDRRHRRCGNITENLAYVVDHCIRYSGLYLARHNSVVTRIKKAASGWCAILSENQVCGNGGLHPDLVVKKVNKVFVIDVSIPFENRINTFKVSANERVERYNQLSDELASLHDAETMVIPLINRGRPGFMASSER